MSELKDHLARVQDIADRARAFQAKEASDPKAFLATLVEDLGVLADAVSLIIQREGP